MERTYLLKDRNGMLVRVPESKLREWSKQQEGEAKAPAEDEKEQANIQAAASTEYKSCQDERSILHDDGHASSADRDGDKRKDNNECCEDRYVR